jgi:hypothetical protein
MPLQLTPGDRKVLLIAAGVLVAMLATSLILARGASTDEDIPSTYSAASGGSKAAFLLLRESGYHVDTWEKPLRDLPAGRDTTLVLAEPAGFPAGGEKQKLAEFLNSGGRLIAAGRFAGFYLPTDEETAAPLGGDAWTRVPALSLSPITRAAPEITLAPRAYWRDHAKVVPLYGEIDKPVVVEYKVGEGSVLWLAEPAPLTNAGLKEPGNLEFMLAAIGKPEGKQILWDEYVHGYERSNITAKSRSVIGWIGLQLAIFAVAILATYSRRSGPVWIPEAESRLSPLEFVRTLGGLYQHANASSVAVEIFYQRFRYLLTRRLGVSIHSSVSDLDRSLRERGTIEDKTFTETLTACEACRYDPDVSPSMALRLVQALFHYSQKLKLTRAQQGEKNSWKRL